MPAVLAYGRAPVWWCAVLVARKEGWRGAWEECWRAARENCWRAVRQECWRPAPWLRPATAAMAMADGSSCRQLVCGRETVCQRDRSILKSPVTLACPTILTRHFPRSAAHPEPVCLSRSVRDTRAPSRAPDADRKMPVRILIVNPQWPVCFQSLRPARSCSCAAADPVLKTPSGSIPPRHYPFINHDCEPPRGRELHDSGLFSSFNRQVSAPGPGRQLVRS